LRRVSLGLTKKAEAQCASAFLLPNPNSIAEIWKSWISRIDAMQTMEGFWTMMSGADQYL
jgi:hypothetical protein